MAKHRADEPNPDDVLDVEIVPDADVPDAAVSDAAVSDGVAPLDVVPVETFPPVPVDTGYTPGGVPTFESVREKIETRWGTAIGASELAAETPEGRTVDEQYDARQRAAAERLAQIRASMHEPPAPDPDRP